MDKNRMRNGVKGGTNMARGEQAPLDPVRALPEESPLISRALMPPPPAPPKKEPLLQLEQPSQHMVALKPKYLPNLRGLMFPKLVYEQAKRLVITPLLAYSHDPVAALRLRGARCASFELPKDMFPRGAPVWKITFLPEELLPMGFDAGGVFGTGVLARKYYPTDLLSAEHKGQTPPLFIGHRSSSFILPKGFQAQAQAKGNGKGRGQIQTPPKRIQPLTPAPPPSPAFKRSILKPSAEVTAEMNRRLALHNISVVEMVIMPAFRKPPSRYPAAVPMQMQYNMYAPDMSRVIFAMQEISPIIVAIISTVHQPNVPAVALSTMDNEPCPRFTLPADIFPVDTNRQGPRFLPQRFLPDFCDAGCVFPPGSLPDSVFQGAIRAHMDLAQHHYSMTPPLFVGRRKQQQQQQKGGKEMVQVYKIDTIAMQLKKLALRNMAATKQNPNTRVPLPESTKRSNDFKMSVAAGKPKGFVLIESDHVPRGAIRTDFFGAFLMGCFFKIIPDVKCLFESTSESEEDDEDLYAMDYPVTGLKEGKAYQVGETEAGKAVVKETKAGEAEVKKPETGETEVKGTKVEAEETEAEDPEAGEAEVKEREAEETVRETKVEQSEVETEVEVETDDEAEVEIKVKTEVETEDYETEECVAEEFESEDCESEGYEAEEVESDGYEADDCETEEFEADECETDEFDPDDCESEEHDPEEVETDEFDPDDCESDEFEAEQSEGEKPQTGPQHDDSHIAQPVAKKSNLNVRLTDNDKNDSTKPACPGCAKIYSYFTVDSNLDDIAEAAGDLDTARFEVIVHPSELPGMNVERAVEQFRQVLRCRNEIRAKMTGMISAHVVKMEADHKLLLASSAPAAISKRVFRKPCSHCGKPH